MTGKLFGLVKAMVTAAILLFPIASVAEQTDLAASDQGKIHSKAAEHSRAIDLVDDSLVLSPPGLERIVFIHHRKGFGKPPWASSGSKKTESKCYSFLARGTKWRSLPVNYRVNPMNESGLDELSVSIAIEMGASEWDLNTGAGLFGSYAIDYSATWDGNVPDGTNEFVFGDYPEEGVIGVTVAWGYFSGPPSTREIIEFDILFDIDFAWGDAVDDPERMDLQNIATHEIGHGLGLGDLYEESCSAETMYGYSDYGETVKRDLNAGDKRGIQELYGK